MRGKLIPLAVSVIGLLTCCVPVLAHHSMSMYDHEQLTTLKAVITAFAFINPHVEIHFDVEGAQGRTEKWAAIGPSPHRLSRSGWERDILHAGDRVTIIGNRAKDGTNTMRLVKLILANGREFRAYGRR